MLKILWKMGEIAPQEQFLPLSTLFYYLMLDFYVKTGIRFSIRDKRLFEITEVEITRVDCKCYARFAEHKRSRLEMLKMTSQSGAALRCNFEQCIMMQVYTQHKEMLINDVRAY